MHYTALVLWFSVNESTKGDTLTEKTKQIPKEYLKNKFTAGQLVMFFNLLPITLHNHTFQEKKVNLDIFL